MDFKNLTYEKSDGIGVITLNRPKILNAINDKLLREVSELIDVVKADDEVKAIIITGGNKVFAAGADIAYMSAIDSLQAEEFMALVGESMDKLANLNKPVIAAIAGLALGGGCELALSCDIRLAAEGAVIGLPEINVGVFPGGGGTQKLTKIVGLGWAKYMIMTGQPVDADTALKIGLVTRVVPVDSLMEEAKKLARDLAGKSAIAMRLVKKCIDYGENVDLPSGLLYEQKTWAFLLGTEDGKEGLKAFIEKRPAVYKGK